MSDVKTEPSSPELLEQPEQETPEKNGIKPRGKRALKDGNPVRSSQRRKRACDTSVHHPPDAKKRNLNKTVRQCEIAGCNLKAPTCFANVTERCAKSGYTSRWYHISVGEHFCNECFEFFYRSYKDGFSMFHEWKNQWTSNARTEASLKRFIVDKIMPFWVQCTNPSCGKWCQLSQNRQLTTDLISKFTCSKNMDKNSKKNGCEFSEDPRTSLAINGAWIETLHFPPYLIDSPAAQFLGAYYPEGVGLSPTCNACIQAKKVYQENNSDNDSNGSHQLAVSVPGVNPNFQPFYQPHEQGKAMCFRPDVMEPDEIAEFSELVREHVLYLAVRNLTIALWNLDCKKWVTIEDVKNNLICRGLIRIRCLHNAHSILAYLTRKGIINVGLVSPPSGVSLVPSKYKGKVIVIGAGTSGIVAARQLQNFGFQVTILEARARTGGRVCDDKSLGVTVGMGAQIVTGVINNPFTLLSEQSGIKLRYIGEKCELYNIKGLTSDCDADKHVEQHFNSILEAVANWRKNQHADISLYDKLMEMHKINLDETKLDFSSEEMALFQFHISNLEYACGSSINNVSAIHWDQNDNFPQFAGDHILLTHGYSYFLSKLCEGLDVRLNMKVKKVDYTKDDIVVTTSDEVIHADKVVVTLPVALLQQNVVEFAPPLLERKLKAIQSLGAGVIEKIALQFPKRFWDKKLGNDDFFGYIPEIDNGRGQFAIFYDIAPQNRNKENGPHVLMTYVSGDAVKLTEENDDDRVIEICMKILRGIFSDTDVPNPSKYFVTHWQRDPYALMAYSYIKMGATGDTYDVLAEDIDKKIYFAGEATNRQFPQTVTGAYMSGIRESSKILKHVIA